MWVSFKTSISMLMTPSIVFFPVLMQGCGSSYSPPTGDKASYCANFKESSDCSLTGWLASWTDLFSPDDQPHGKCQHLPLRYIDSESSRTMSFSGKTVCGDTWGKRFNASTPVHPVLTVDATDACRGKVDFSSKVPADAPAQEYVRNGALQFTIIQGRVNGTRVLKFNGLYDGRGGPWLNDEGKHVQVPTSDCDNIWAYYGGETLFA
eukprot:TRINITY_DN61115_c0_g1_i1.p1 TRINITY_DN61115_c0_g1~~TRINITY_DN61115_c0_g1_i1.p1  ORF type:complete len:207 (+),score=20.39 TRINITY_DN61115_c0_g1_i1:220-840(+)